MDIFQRLPIELQKHIYDIYLGLWWDINEEKLQKRHYQEYKFVLNEFEDKFSVQYNRFNIDLKKYTSAYLDTSYASHQDYLHLKWERFCIELERRRLYRRKSFHSKRRNNIQNNIRYSKFDLDDNLN